MAHALPSPHLAGDARLAVHQALRVARQRLGDAADHDAGDHRRVAQVPVGLALPRAHLLVGGHHAPDAHRSQALHAGPPSSR
eukprot:5703040-Prymnesium_polylepis.1